VFYKTHFYKGPLLSFPHSICMLNAQQMTNFGHNATRRQSTKSTTHRVPKMWGRTKKKRGRGLTKKQIRRMQIRSGRLMTRVPPSRLPTLFIPILPCIHILPGITEREIINRKGSTTSAASELIFHQPAICKPQSK